MKKIYILMFVLVSAVTSLAANITREWSEGPISWANFRGSSIVPGVPSFLRANLSIVPKQVKVDGKDIIQLKAIAVMDEDRSFADSASINEQRLRLHQLQFDLLESYRRDLQNDINSGMTGTQADERVKYYNKLYNSTIDRVIEQTDNGKNDAKLQEWEYYARKGLDERILPPVRRITQGPFKYGFYFGTGAMFPTSNIKYAFSGSWTFTVGLNFAYRRINFKADLSYGQPKINNLNVMGVKDQAATGTYASMLTSNISLGYSVIDTKRITITPNFGGMWSYYQWNVGNYKLDPETNKYKLDNSESPRIHDFNWSASIDFDFHFYTSISQNAFFLTGRREQYISSIRLSPFVTHMTYNKPNPSLSGYQIGFTIAYVGIARSLGF